MLFNSITFFVFLVPVFIIYWYSRQFSKQLGKTVLLVSSYIFYGWWDWRFLSLILLSSLTDFIIGKQIFNTQSQKKRKWLLIISITINIGILFIFKYFNFFIDSLSHLTGTAIIESWSTLRIVLPVGISFYTFQTLSYTIDIYRKKIEPTLSALTFFTFVAFFPQLVAGPIERAKRLLPQFKILPAFSFRQAKSGMQLMLWGLLKKMVIADQLAQLVDVVYSQPDNYNGFTLLIATVLFGFQIYCDFSGYSDIAIGTARLFGIELMINFDTPYFSKSIREFWQRWHISLSTWFRDYLYIPLGGNRNGKFLWIRNILLTFAISGLWHGANLTFIIWGFFHGALLIIERLLSPLVKLNRRVKNTLGLILVFSLVNLGWIFFRSQSTNEAATTIMKIFNFGSWQINELWISFIKNPDFTETVRVLYSILPLFLIVEILISKKSFSSLIIKLPKYIQPVIYFFIVLVILFFGKLNAAPQFIYFQF